MTPMLELTLNFDQDTVAPGEPIKGVVRLRNAGSQSVRVNGRLAINTPYAPEEMRDLAFTVNDPSGSVLDFQLKVNVGAPADDEFKTLPPGEAIEKQFDLARYYDLKQAGAYSVRAEYQNQSEPQSPSGAPIWKGALASPVEHITV